MVYIYRPPIYLSKLQSPLIPLWLSPFRSSQPKQSNNLNNYSPNPCVYVIAFLFFFLPFLFKDKEERQKTRSWEMSCNGCRVLRKGCSESCILRPCLQWIESPESQGHATVFVAKFFGRAGLMSFISAVPESQRPGMYIFLHMYNVIRALFLFYFVWVLSKYPISLFLLLLLQRCFSLCCTKPVAELWILWMEL